MTLASIKAEIKSKEDLIKSLKQEIQIAESELETLSQEKPRQCIKEFGAHKDDGGFIYGFCTRCGECLG